MVNSDDEWRFGEYTSNKKWTGDFREYNEDGSYSFGNYINGNKQNIWIELKLNGDEYESKYVDDEVVGSKVTWKDGKVVARGKSSSNSSDY